MELKAAIKQRKQVYICIDSGVYSEYQIYRLNKNKDIDYSHVDNVKVHQFIEEISELPGNNQIVPFSEIPNLIAYLKEQWAGILEGHLEKRSEERVAQSVVQIESSVTTLDKLINILKKDVIERSDNQPDIKLQLESFLIQNHPIFSAMKVALKSPYRLFFTTKSELDIWLSTARGGRDISTRHPIDEDNFEYTLNVGRESHRMDVARLLFDLEGNLKPMQAISWRDEYLSVWKPQAPKPGDIDDDIPF